MAEPASDGPLPPEAPKLPDAPRRNSGEGAESALRHLIVQRESVERDAAARARDDLDPAVTSAP